MIESNLEINKTGVQEAEAISQGSDTGEPELPINKASRIQVNPQATELCILEMDGLRVELQSMIHDAVVLSDRAWAIYITYKSQKGDKNKPNYCN